MFRFKVELWGRYAYFARPELEDENVSYDVITPHAARLALETAFWKPSIEYFIDEIAVCSPILFEKTRSNKNYPDSEVTALKGVRYVITAHFKITNHIEPWQTESEIVDKFHTRLKVRNYRCPYFGTKDFPANIRLVDENEEPKAPIDETRSLGLMLYDTEHLPEIREDGLELMKESEPMYFMAEMKNGVIDLRNVDVFK